MGSSRAMDWGSVKGWFRAKDSGLAMDLFPAKGLGSVTGSGRP